MPEASTWKSAKTLPPCRLKQKLQGRVGITGNAVTSILTVIVEFKEA